MENFVDFLGFVGVMATVIGLPMFMIFAVPPIAKAFARRVEGRAVPSDETLAELDALREELADLRALAPRLAELEERVDFAERLLARPTADSALPLSTGDPS